MKSVLIVDDSEFIRNILYKIFNEQSFSIVGMAANGLEAIDQFRNLNPDYMTLDISMPIMDGLKALKRIREMDSKVIIIVISSLSAKQNMEELYDVGANYFIAKPFDEADIVGAIRHFQ